MMDNIWQLQTAKSRFSEVIDRTLAQGVQIITRRGRKAVVMIPFDEYERLTGRYGRLSQFFKESPLAHSGIVIDRDKSLPRDLKIDL